MYEEPRGFLGQLKHAPSQGGVSPAVRCAENIALLGLLDPVPGHLSIHTPQRSLQDIHGDVDRVLSVEQESELSSNLAFLAAITDDHEHIMSVCIEELPRVEGCQVLIAINKRLPTDGADILKKVQRGFQQIFGRLREVSSENILVIEEAVFNDIIALCRERILSRLRSRRSTSTSIKSQKRFIGLVLKEFLGTPYRIDASSNQVSYDYLFMYRRRLKTLSEQLDGFEAADIVRHEDLARIVGHIAQCMEAIPLAELLGVLRNQDMDPKARDRLLSCFSKIARYRECARLLCRRAGKIPMLRNIVVQQVQSAAQTGAGSFPTYTPVDLEQSLERFQYNEQPVRISTLPDWLRKIAMSSKSSFSKTVVMIQKQSKVHAEIQLLAHYDNASDDVVLPRILAASKDACYLCHSLIRVQGRYEVPRTHGRLYQRWCLPIIYQEGPLQRSLNSLLEAHISASLQRLMTLARRPVTAFPNESSIFPINVSASTLAGPSSSVISNNLTPGVTAPAQPPEDNVTDSKTDQAISEISEGKNRMDTAADAGVSEAGDESAHDVGNEVADQGEIADEAHVAKNDTDDTESGSFRDITEGSIYIASDLPRKSLEPGQTTTFAPGPDSRTHFRTNRINLFIDDTSGRLSFRWLSEPEAEAVLRTNTNAVVDVESTSFGVDVTMVKDAEGPTYLAYGGEVIMIHALEPQSPSS